MDPAGKRLKIPICMLSRECAGVKITERPYLSKEALLSLALLISPPLTPKTIFKITFSKRLLKDAREVVVIN